MLHWLIRAAALVAGAATVKTLSDDGKKSSSISRDSYEEVERRKARHLEQKVKELQKFKENFCAAMKEKYDSEVKFSSNSSPISEAIASSLFTPEP